MSRISLINLKFPLDTTRTTTNHHHPVQTKPVNNPILKPPDKPASGGSGFMSSYLKFLQGVRDTSPPPAVRGGNRKTSTTWTTQTPIKPEEKPPESNGVPPVVPPVVIPPPLPQPITRLSQGDPQDDPR